MIRLAEAEVQRPQHEASHRHHLRRQQAQAIIAARSLIVQGAVGMVELALTGLQERGLVALDDERKAAMVTNLLVVLCSDHDAQPVVNTGTLYN